MGCRLTPFAGTAFMLAALSACERSGRSVLGAVVSDSAGVRISVVPSLRQVRGVEWGTRTLYSTEKMDFPFHEVRAGAFLRDGSLLIANSGSSELVLIDSAGSRTRQIGRRGQGPGEYDYVNWLESKDDGSILVHDAGLLRLTTLNSDFTVRDARSLAAGGPFTSLLPLAITPDGTILATHWMSNIFHLGEWRDTIPLLRISPNGSGVDSLGLWASREKAAVQTSSGRLRLPIGFARTAYAIGKDSHIAIGSTDSLRISVFRADGSSVLRLRGPRSQRQVTDRDRDRWTIAVTAQAPVDNEEFLSSWISGPTRETFPAFDALALDDEDGLWVGESPSPGATKRAWVVFSLDGLVRGRLELPTSDAHPLFPFPEILDIRRRRVAVLHRNKWNEQIITVMSFDPN